MLDFEKELGKYKPSLEVEEVEKSITRSDLSDVTDLIKEIIEENSERARASR